LALEALPKSMENPDRPYVFEAEVALYNSVINQREYATLKKSEKDDFSFQKAEFSSDGKSVKLKKWQKLTPCFKADLNQITQQIKSDVAMKLSEKAIELAKEGNIKQATANFKVVLKLDSGDLDFSDPETKAKQIFTEKLVEQGSKLVEQGKIIAAIAKYEQAQQMNADVHIQWHKLCLNGSLYGHAAKVIQACEKPEPSDNKSEYYASRGLARALTGNTQGAIEDFQFFVDLATTQQKEELYMIDIDTPEWWKQQKQQLQSWIADLKKGENPFTEEVLENLKKLPEYFCIKCSIMNELIKTGVIHVDY
jgi:tetratricopeptide (TPR) repeat protein